MTAPLPPANEPADGIDPAALTEPAACDLTVAGHCWHMPSQVVFAIRNPPRMERCCHCGAERTLKWDPSATGGHGPFAENRGAYVPGDPA